MVELYQFSVLPSYYIHSCEFRRVVLQVVTVFACTVWKVRHVRGFAEEVPAIQQGDSPNVRLSFLRFRFK